MHIRESGGKLMLKRSGNTKPVISKSGDKPILRRSESTRRVIGREWRKGKKKKKR